LKIVCIGGGPAGLYFALLMKQADASHDITVVERNKPYDTFGWGVVFSDATLENMRRCDAKTAGQIESSFVHWDDIELDFRGRTIRSGGHGFIGIGRKHLLNILQARCEELGVVLRFETEVDSDEDFPDADLIIASDGINSKIRTKYAHIFKPDIVTRPNRFIWLGTKHLWDAFNFTFEKTEHGWFQAHIYKFDDSTSTFIVETPEHVWKAHGLDTATPDESVAFCEKLFARTLDGHALMTNARHLRGSAWLNFQRVRCEQWHHFNGRSHVVRLGAYRPLRHRLRDEAGDRGCDRAGGAVQNLGARTEARRRTGNAEGVTWRNPPAISGHPRGGCAPAAERGVECDGVVRERRRALRRLAATRAVHVFAADAVAADQP
jgi:anthraniloyl-CoA monooxygenase